MIFLFFGHPVLPTAIVTTYGILAAFPVKTINQYPLTESESTYPIPQSFKTAAVSSPAARAPNCTSLAVRLKRGAGAG